MTRCLHTMSANSAVKLNAWMSEVWILWENSKWMKITGFVCIIHVFKCHREKISSNSKIGKTCCVVRIQLFTDPSIIYLYFLSVKGHGKPGANPSWLHTRGRVHSEQYLWFRDKYPFILTFTQAIHSSQMAKSLDHGRNQRIQRKPTQELEEYAHTTSSQKDPS